MEGKQSVRPYGRVVYVMERLFAALLRISPATWWLSTRVESQSRLRILDDQMDQQAWEDASQRAHSMEAYIIIWLGVLLICSTIAWVPSWPVRWLVTVVALFRVLDILVAAVNMGLFDRLRLGRPVSYVSGIERNLLLSLWNYFEILFAFGIVYTAGRHLLQNSGSLLDGYYFSVITQLTIGYGDLLPLRELKVFAMAQGLIGLLFVLLVLGRFVQGLPKARGFLEP